MYGREGGLSSQPTHDSCAGRADGRRGVPGAGAVFAPDSTGSAVAGQGSAIERGPEESTMNKDLDGLYRHIDDIEIAMMTTRRTDGHLQSRAMATQKRMPGADLWFVCRQGSAKLRDLAADPHLNLSYYKDRTREWVSISGLATISRDRAKIHELYAPDWSVWFPADGDPWHGTKDDPRMVLIGVTVHAAVYLEVDKPQPLVLFELVKGWVTGTEPELGQTHRVGQ
jgi:general stress protein 26